MRRDLLLCRYLLLAALLPLAGCAEPTAAPAAASEQTPWYENGSASRDGTGRYYMGREISHVMGHLGAGWLERPSREREERTDLLLENLPLKPGDIAADLGAGTGYFTLPIAGIVGPGACSPSTSSRKCCRSSAHGSRRGDCRTSIPSWPARLIRGCRRPVWPAAAGGRLSRVLSPARSHGRRGAGPQAGRACDFGGIPGRRPVCADQAAA